MLASEYQLAVKALLERRALDVRLEWSVTKDASDALAMDINRYAPRADIAVGPFNTTPGLDSELDHALLPEELQILFAACQVNANPRCLLAIEVSFSGSSKHVMGDILNASALGLYGIVVGSDPMMPKIQRILQYLEVLAELEKLPRLFQNVVAMHVTEFDAVLRAE